MSDTELLNLIEHYKWIVTPLLLGGWMIESAENGDVRKLVCTRGSLRDTVTLALKAQAERALARQLT